MSQSLTEWLARLESRHPVAIEMGLDRIRAVASPLGLDRPVCPVITVAGTNGKGSTVATLTAIYREAGYRVGTYTSPHLERFNERISLQGEPVDDSRIVAAFERVDAVRESLDISLTYFEFTTLAAFQVFRESSPDILILEVGLGGRLDAVNLVDPDVAVITSIGIDHVEWLGDTREAIGREKAGIFRTGIPVVCGDADPPASVVRHAEELGCAFCLKGRDFRMTRHEDHPAWEAASGALLVLPPLRLSPENVATAIAAVRLAPLPVDDDAVRRGAAAAALAGRAERRRRDGVEIVLDVAHNPHGAAFFMQQLPAIPGRTRAVLAMLADKDADGTLDACLGRVDAWFPATLEGARGGSARALAERMLARGLVVAGPLSGVPAALSAALKSSAPGDRILVLGSFLTVAAARQWLDKKDGYGN